MPATVVLIRAFRRGGRIYFRFKDKTEYEFSDLEQIRNWLRQSSTDDREEAHRLAVRYMLARSADGSSDASIRGQRFTVDLSSPTPITVTPDV